MYKVNMHDGTMRKLLNGCAYVREIKLMNYLAVNTHKHEHVFLLTDHGRTDSLSDYSAHRWAVQDW